MTTITIERTILDRLIEAWDSTVLPTHRDGMMQERMEDLRAELAKPVEPVEPAAWRTFDGEGGYMFRAYEDNEDYQEWFEKRNPHHKGWVEPLYLHPPTPAWHDAPTEPGIWLCDEGGPDCYTYTAHNIVLLNDPALKDDECRRYGPIPQDKKGGAA